MVEELIENLNGILKEKNEKIKPENIREGIQIFDITGEFKGGGFDNIEETAEYQACLLLANSIEVFDNYTGTTATPEDIVEGKTAYSNGERITGTMQANGNNAKMIDVNNQWVSTFSFKEIINKLDFTNVDFKSVNKFSTAFSQYPYLEEVIGLNTPNATTMNSMFYNCYELHTINELNTSKLINGTSMTEMFTGCTKLSDESLNNILAMCANAVKITSVAYKSLKYIGLNSDQATRCQSLPNYQAFLSAGWTTGY